VVNRNLQHLVVINFNVQFYSVNILYIVAIEDAGNI